MGCCGKIGSRGVNCWFMGGSVIDWISGAGVKTWLIGVNGRKGVGVIGENGIMVVFCGV